jgi:GTPase SAR1 family protein
MWRDELLSTADPEEPETFPFFLFGNKKDLVKADKSKRQISKEDVEAWTKKGSRPIPYMETSALDGHNINEVFNKLSLSLLKDSIAKVIAQSLRSNSSCDSLSRS